jgi:hypothetical protein
MKLSYRSRISGIALLLAAALLSQTGQAPGLTHEISHLNAALKRGDK